MSLFDLFVKLNHPSSRKGWIETTAVFTGRSEKAAIGKPGHYKAADYSEYEIRYRTDKGEQTAWYVFSPLEDPAPEELQGRELAIRYCKRKPWRYEVIS